MDFSKGSIIKLETQDGVPFTVKVTNIYKDSNTGDIGLITVNTSSGKLIAGGEILPTSWYIARAPKPRDWVEVVEEAPKA